MTTRHLPVFGKVYPERGWYGARVFFSVIIPLS